MSHCPNESARQRGKDSPAEEAAREAPRSDIQPTTPESPPAHSEGTAESLSSADLGVESREAQPRRLMPVTELPAHLVIYEREAFQIGASLGFLASNEHDFWRHPIDATPADIFMGFGNNTIYDLAMRRNAEVMIVADRDPDVLRAHEFLYKPAALLARTPAEFLSILCGVHAQEDRNLDVVFHSLAENRVMSDSSPSVFRNRVRFLKEVEDRAQAHPLLGETHARFLHNYYGWLADPSSGRETYVTVFDPYHYDGGTADAMRLIFERYCPRYAIDNGASPSIVRDPHYSIVSSPKALGWLRGIFEREQVHYMLSDIADGHAYHAAGEFARAQGRSISGLSVCNIPEAVCGDRLKSNPLIFRLGQLSFQELPVDESFAIYVTRGLGYEHRFERYRAGSANELRAQIRRSGYPIASLERASDFEYAVRAMTEGEFGIATKGHGNLDMHFNNRFVVRVVPWPDRLDLPGSTTELVQEIDFRSFPRSSDLQIETHFTSEAERRIVHAAALLMLCHTAPHSIDCREYVEQHRLNPHELRKIILTESQKLYRPSFDTQRALQALLDPLMGELLS